ncbi:MAG: hypothetical protein OEW69_09275 [Nitrospirota bacterium]|nr:hypothetical protein [Nitrospirota bacterium]
MYMTKRRGKDVIVIDSRPPPRIRRAEARLQKRLRESYEAYGSLRNIRRDQKNGNNHS